MTVVNIIHHDDLPDEVIDYLSGMTPAEIDAFTFGTLFTAQGIPTIALKNAALAALDRRKKTTASPAVPAPEPVAPPAPVAGDPPSDAPTVVASPPLPPSPTPPGS